MGKIHKLNVVKSCTVHSIIWKILVHCLDLLNCDNRELQVRILLSIIFFITRCLNNELKLSTKKVLRWGLEIQGEYVSYCYDVSHLKQYLKAVLFEIQIRVGL